MTWLPQPLPHHSYAHVSELGYQAVRRALFGPSPSRSIRKDAEAYKVKLRETTEALKAIRRAARGRAAL